MPALHFHSASSTSTFIFRGCLAKCWALSLAPSWGAKAGQAAGGEAAGVAAKRAPGANPNFWVRRAGKGALRCVWLHY